MPPWGMCRGLGCCGGNHYGYTKHGHLTKRAVAIHPPGDLRGCQVTTYMPLVCTGIRGGAGDEWLCSVYRFVSYKP